MGSWQIADVLCDKCSGPVLSEKGKLIEFGKNRIINPIAGNCEEGSSYALLKNTSAKEIIAAQGLGLPSAARTALQTAKTALYGIVGCDGINYIRIAVLPNETAMYFEEGSLVFLLERRRPGH
jgi:hypothetical protein